LPTALLYIVVGEKELSAKYLFADYRTIDKEILSGKNLLVPTAPDAVTFADRSAVRLSAKIVLYRQPNTAVGKALSFF
jgi:hypothetical protein